MLQTSYCRSLNELARECYADNQHWWHDPRTGEYMDRDRGELLMLVISEIAEAMEGERKDLWDDKIPSRKMAEVELADAIIRLMDIAGADDLDLDGAPNYSVDKYPPRNKAHALLLICKEICKAHDSYKISREDTLFYAKGTYSAFLKRAVVMIEQYAKHHGYDLYGAVAEKREYNRNRPDHKPENRLKPGGKAF
jgi:hypothetical protein